jgi:hypothetical protein
MEIIEEDDEEIKQLMLRISNKEITLCETCDAFFDYIPQKVFCDECMTNRMREYYRRPEYKAKMREYEQRPEYKAKRREYQQRPEVKERKREREESPEYKAKRRERYLRNKKLREEE